MYNLPPELKVEAHGAIRTVTMNRPEDMNAANSEMLFALTDLCRLLSEDPDVRVVILTGAGSAFSAGGDFQHLARTAYELEYAETTMNNARQFIRAMVELPIPVIAAVNGPAVGFGATLASLCDLVLVSDKAYFAEPHINVGLVVGDGIAVTWPLYMSMLKAKEFIFTGQRIQPQQAVDCGLANRVVSHQQLMSESLLLAEQMAGQPSEALKDTKRIMNLYLQQNITNVLDTHLATQLLATQRPAHRNIVEKLIAKQRRKEQTN